MSTVAEGWGLVDADFYALFLVRMLNLISAAPMTVDDIATHLALEKSQVKAWLKRAVSDGKITKLTKPVRYRMATAGQRQASLFGEG